MVGDRIVFMGGQGANARAWSLKEVPSLNINALHLV